MAKMIPPPSRHQLTLLWQRTARQQQRPLRIERWYHHSSCSFVASYTSSSVSVLRSSSQRDTTKEDPLQEYDFTSKECNIPLQIQQQLGRNLYLQPNHPLCLVQEQIAQYFNHVLPTRISASELKLKFQKEQKLSDNFCRHVLENIHDQVYTLPPDHQQQQQQYFPVYDRLSPIVTIKECFDELLISTFHPSRQKSDTYFVNETHVLRPHTSAHQIPLMRELVLRNRDNNARNNVGDTDTDTNNANNANNASDNDDANVNVNHHGDHEEQEQPNSNTTKADFSHPHNPCHTIRNPHATITTTRNTVQFLCVGDVYRRDEIDKSHYPIFHQMEGVKLFHIPQLRTYPNSQYNMVQDYIKYHLKHTLEGLIRFLFEQRGVTDIPMRWRKDNFPFTDPSYELDIFYHNEWMEILGCGLIRYELLEQVNWYLTEEEAQTISPNFYDHSVEVPAVHHSKNILCYKTHKGWAFGIGLERLAMILFQIPDIRLFWSDDVRFHEQFRSSPSSSSSPSSGGLRNIPNFVPYSKYPPCTKDISFWIGDYENYSSNDTYEIIREIGGDLVERAELIDSFTKLSKKDIFLTKVSHCYRITYRSMDRSLTNAEVDAIQEQIREQVVRRLKVQLR